ncbi:MAG TPA: glycosyltransferase [Roseiflexaceae bacterium]|nr:glycosyltransferase [Roseiflexaceae bacterium]
MGTIGYIIRSYPRLSQTFILNEILALEEAGVQLRLFPITDPREPVVQAQASEVRAPIEYLEAAMRRGRLARLADHAWAARSAPLRYARTLAYVLRHAELDQGYTAASRWECFAEALYLARSLRQERQNGQQVTHLHAHFAHDPTLIALLVQQLTGLSYSFTAHARDLFQIPQAALTERIANASAVITCSGGNLDYLYESARPADHAKIRLIHHGVDLRGFQPAGSQESGVRSQGHSAANSQLPAPNSRPLILSVGRLVEKKGFPDLLLACARLKQRGTPFRLAIYGDGPLHNELMALIAQHDLHDEVELPGAIAQRDLIPVFQRASVFALAPFVTEDGDRDGVPNVLVEAMACGLPVVSTAISGIPELVVHERNGMLVAPRDPDAFADALAVLLQDPAKRAEMGAAARRTVVEGFDLRAAARELAALFGDTSSAVAQPSWGST